ncbi:hypothetical protein MP228_005050 [Amoeboaphelidium protococcarum]|nr:hypothetical protein MP228_005050 [Amoeboaphelidium protococcarum]
MKPLLQNVLVANRGEIALRVLRTAHRLGIKTSTIYSDADVNARHATVQSPLHVGAYRVGPPVSAQSYLNIPAVCAAVKESGADAVHGGYGFLSENANFVKALNEMGVKFIGPSYSAMYQMGDKLTSKKIAREAKVNTIPGYSGAVKDADHAIQIAKDIIGGYPVMIKAAHGGGGKGMRVAYTDEDVREGFELARNEAISSFGDPTLLVEKFIEQPRHIEIQLMGDQHGNVFYFPERECSIQRRNQKVIEEAPSPFLTQEIRDAMGKQAVALAKKVGYFSAGTVEFLVDVNKNFYFLEMNTRLQVEHPITEYITGVDLVEQMLRVAAGHDLTKRYEGMIPDPETGGMKPYVYEALNQDQIRKPSGWAVECRVYAEDPTKFLPSIGTLSKYIEPKPTVGADSPDAPLIGGQPFPNVRCDSGVREGSEISMYYDPLICKLITHGNERREAIDGMVKALDHYVIKGVTHNIPLLREVLVHPRFLDGSKISTKFLPEEYPKGFQGHHLTKAEEQQLIAIGACIFAQRDLRDWSFVDTNRPHSKYPTQWELSVQVNGDMDPKHGAKDSKKQQAKNVVVQVSPEAEFTIIIDGEQFKVKAPWTLEYPIVEAKVKDIAQKKESNEVAQYLASNAQVLLLSYLGTKYHLNILTKKQAALKQFMKPIKQLDLSKMVMSPMPGQVVSVAVKEGDIVIEGSQVAVVEAMKMQNVLRTTAAGRVKKVRVKPGGSVKANDILIDLEEVNGSTNGGAAGKKADK